MAKPKTVCRMDFSARVLSDGSTASTYGLPMHSADTKQAESMAASAMQTVNAMLDFSKSNVRLVPWDIEKDERMSVSKQKS